jgi:hypothetical protein
MYQNKKIIKITYMIEIPLLALNKIEQKVAPVDGVV